jgi:hypothetical protein
MNQQQQSQELSESLVGCSTYGHDITNMQIRPPNSSGSSRSYQSGSDYDNHQDTSKRHSNQKRGFSSSALALYFRNSVSPRLPPNTPTSSKKSILSLGNKNDTQYTTSGNGAITSPTNMMPPWEKANHVDDYTMER